MQLQVLPRLFTTLRVGLGSASCLLMVSNLQLQMLRYDVGILIEETFHIEKIDDDFLSISHLRADRRQHRLGLMTKIKSRRLDFRYSLADLLAAPAPLAQMRRHGDE